MEFSDIVPYIIGYFIGFVLSLLFLSQFGKKIGWGDYDPPHNDDYYDDYTSNASAYFAFSTMWPLFYLGNIIGFIYRTFIELYKKIIK